MMSRNPDDDNLGSLVWFCLTLYMWRQSLDPEVQLPAQPTDLALVLSIVLGASLPVKWSCHLDLARPRRRF